MLSKRSSQALSNAIADIQAAKEIATALIAGPHAQAAAVTAIEPTVNMPAVSSTLSTSDTYTDAAVKTAIDGAGNALRVSAEARLDAIEAKLDAVIASLKASGLMQS